MFLISYPEQVGNKNFNPESTKRMIWFRAFVIYFNFATNNKISRMKEPSIGHPDLKNQDPAPHRFARPQGSSIWAATVSAVVLFQKTFCPQFFRIPQTNEHIPAKQRNLKTKRWRWSEMSAEKNRKTDNSPKSNPVQWSSPHDRVWRWPAGWKPPEI